jgi:hypothetical protein
MSTDEEELPDDPLVRQRVSAPGLLLMLVGLLTLICGLIFLQLGIHSLRLTPAQNRDEHVDETRQLQERGWSSPEFTQRLMEMTPEEIKAYRVGIRLGLAAVWLAGAFVMTYGGFNLRSLNSYRLAMAGAIWTAVPLMSPLACCGIGELVGIWAFAVLMDRTVREAFP